MCLCAVVSFKTVKRHTDADIQALLCAATAAVRGLLWFIAAAAVNRLQAGCFQTGVWHTQPPRSSAFSTHTYSPTARSQAGTIHNVGGLRGDKEVLTVPTEPGGLTLSLLLLYSAFMVVEL